MRFAGGMPQSQCWCRPTLHFDLCLPRGDHTLLQMYVLHVPHSAFPAPQGLASWGRLLLGGTWTRHSQLCAPSDTAPAIDVCEVSLRHIDKYLEILFVVRLHHRLPRWLPKREMHSGLRHSDERSRCREPIRSGLPFIFQMSLDDWPCDG